MSGKSRYDKYINLFGKPNDKRVRLLIHELEGEAERQFPGVFKKENVRFAKATLRMMNSVFTNKDSWAKDSDINSEWKLFMYQLAKRLGGTTVTAASDPNGALAVVHSLKGAAGSPKSTAYLVWLLINKIAKVTDKDGNNLADNSDRASEAVKIVYESKDSILTSLIRGQLFFNDNTDDTVFANILGFPQLTGTTNQQIIDRVNDQAIKAELSAAGDATTFKAALAKVMNKDIATYFNYNINEFFVSLMLDEAVTKPVEEESSTFFDDVPADENRYFRNADGLLMERDVNDPNGRPVYTGSKTWETMTMDKCLTTGVAKVSKDGKLTCANYLEDCLSGSSDGLNKCKNYMKDASFWENAKEEAENILPPMITKTLKAFGFDYVQYRSDVTKQNLWKVQSFSNWLNNLTKLAADGKNGLTPDDVVQISKNEKLRGYLEMLIKRVNENPVILNPDYNGPTNRSNRSSDYFKENKLSRFGLLPHEPVNNFMSSVERTNVAVGTALGMQMRAVGLPLGMPLGVPVILTGGAYFNPIDSLEEKYKYPVKQSWSVMERQYDGLIERLKRNNKSISSKDNQQIRSLIEKLKDAEIKLTKAMLYTEKYAKLLEVFDQQDGNNVLSFDHLQQFVDARNNYFKKVYERQNSLVSIIRTVAEAVAKEVKDTQNVNENVVSVSAKNFPVQN